MKVSDSTALTSTTTNNNSNSINSHSSAFIFYESK